MTKGRTLTQPPDDITLLRLAIQNLSCAPQAQRRYVQLGMMRRAVNNLQRIGEQLPALVEAGDLDAQQAEMIGEICASVKANIAADPDFLAESGAAPREFLFGDALETDAWEELRQRARRCYSSLAGDRSPFVAITAR